MVNWYWYIEYLNLQLIWLIRINNIIIKNIAINSKMEYNQNEKIWIKLNKIIWIKLTKKINKNLWK